jgi:flagellar biosynthesis protein FliQ
MGHGLFVFALFGPRTARGFGPDAVPAMAFEALFRHGLFLAASALVISHGVSFVTNYLRPKAYEVSEARTLMFAPYKRIVVLHVVILLGGFFAQSMGNFIVPLVLLVGLKIALDLGAHLAEHRAPILREYKALAETAGVAVVPNKPAGEVVAVKDINDRPLAHYLGGWRLAPGENAPPGWFAGIEFRQSGGKLGVHLVSQPGGAETWTLQSANVRGDASRIEWIEVRLRASGRERILRFTAPGAGGDRLDLNEMQQPEGNPRAMQARSFALMRAGISHPAGVN